ncbi:MAG: phosphate ABC transporter substrate-binding protein PstS [Chloroflexi bacterium]|uniref:Phosphate ABC transporter substrate-binding protein PstS n=1 Tax=Candidatus Chlorohelix allophototropha TaxID=3003348 RepID=A0A8T7M891_9CHLR|nr:phosphate ABC transporter substrate-binding protein PstS [Chloroflexota bacterium]WJW68197.1 phosphate ABC transporter substrate-binding protein PstS [Chloroflexota bacterium L227-S17]
MFSRTKSLNPKFLVALALTLVLALVLTACGDNTATPVPATTAAATTAAGTTTTAAATTAAATTAAATTAAGTTTTAAATTAAATTAAATSAAATAAASVTPPGGYKVTANVTLSGSGATFPDPAYQQWLKDFVAVNPSVKLTYTGVGSGAGRKSFFAGEVDFAGSDGYPTDAEITSYGKPILTIPMTLGAVVLAYNLDGVTTLKLSPDTIGAIYTGKVTKWNDAKIAAENAGVTLPDLAITLAVRQDDSGTSSVFSNWLAEVSPDFKALNAAGSTPKWEAAGLNPVKAPKNDGVTGLIKQTKGTLGYIESSYAQANNIPYALVKNPAGNYVNASVEAISAAALGGSVPDNLKLKVTQSADPKAYPIASTTWIIIPKEIASKDKADAVLRFLWWATQDSAPIETAKKLGYAPLPTAVQDKVRSTLLTVTSGGAPVLK